MTKKSYTPAELKQFDRLTNKLSSQDQMARIEARMAIKPFIELHGQAKCDEMYEVLKKRDGAAAGGNATSEGAFALKPCPFCNSPNIDPKGWASVDRSGPACDDCGGSADSIAQWNDRPREANTPNAHGWREIVANLLDHYLGCYDGNKDQLAFDAEALLSKPLS